jgi:hypothetical protein
MTEKNQVVCALTNITIFFEHGCRGLIRTSATKPFTYYFWAQPGPGNELLRLSHHLKKFFTSIDFFRLTIPRIGVRDGSS